MIFTPTAGGRVAGSLEDELRNRLGWPGLAVVVTAPSPKSKAYVVGAARMTTCRFATVTVWSIGMLSSV